MNRLMEEPDSEGKQKESHSLEMNGPKNLITYLNLKLKNIHNRGRCLGQILIQHSQYSSLSDRITNFLHSSQASHCVY